MKEYSFKLARLSGKEWTRAYRAKSYSDARRQMRLDYPDGKLLDYDMEVVNV